MATKRLIFLVLFVVYFLSGAITMTGFGDSDELIAAGYKLSLAHQPGYPLLTLLIYTVTHIPFVPVSLGVRTLTALLQAAALTLVYTISVTLLPQIKKSYLAALVIIAAGTSGLLWEHGTYIEVFTLNGILSCLYILFSLLLLRTNKQRYWNLWAISIGLGFSHHQTFVFVFIAGVILLRKKILKTNYWQVVFIALTTWLLGYTLPLYFIGASNNPNSWQFTPTLVGIFKYYFRSFYSGYSAEQGVLSAWWSGFNLHTMIESIVFFVSEWWHRWSILGFCGFLFLLAPLPRIQKIIFIGLWLIVGPLFASYIQLATGEMLSVDYEISRATLTRMFVLSDYIWSIFIVVGSYQAIKHLTTIYVKPVLVMIAIAVIARIYWLFPQFDLSSYTAAEKYAASILDQAGPQARILCFSDISGFGLSYQQLVLGKRPDVVVVSAARQYRYMRTQQSFSNLVRRYGDNPVRIGEIIGSSLQQNLPVYVTELTSFWTDELGLDVSGFYLIPSGSAFRITKKYEPNAISISSPASSELINTTPSKQHRYIRALSAVLAEQHTLNAVIYTRMNKQSEALKQIQLARSLNPQNEQLQEIQSNIPNQPSDPRYSSTGIEDHIVAAQARSCGYKQSHSCEIKLYRHLAWRNPSDTFYRQELARAYESVGLLDLAKREYQVIQSLEPNDTLANIKLEQLMKVRDLPGW